MSLFARTFKRPTLTEGTIWCAFCIVLFARIVEKCVGLFRQDHFTNPYARKLMLF